MKISLLIILKYKYSSLLSELNFFIKLKCDKQMSNILTYFLNEKGLNTLTIVIFLMEVTTRLGANYLAYFEKKFYKIIPNFIEMRLTIRLGRNNKAYFQK